ncbi:MAG: isoprenyl transferase [Nitrospiraceae bacterium]|nr:MAG: isoprenyl transferase [Nitrospiraceae bacterium]
MKIKHVALIMDGNGRWAKQRGLPRIEGHRNGVKKVNEIIDAALEHRLKAVTFYTFSMENWRRPKAEINALMGLLKNFIKSEMKRLHSKNIVFRAVGAIEMLPSGVKKVISEFEELTRNNTGLIVSSALSYGGRAEIVNAIKGILEKGVQPEDVNEELVASCLYTAGIPDPDLIIRTSGEMRLSNFLLWQSAYTEFYFTDIHWPDFGREEFKAAVDEYKRRERRFGALSDEEDSR